jgi:exportin-2 (importin alpha re-exporter)
MAELFENLIIPNIGINKAHIALFEEEIELYIDYYFRNTEIQTRRAAALELLRVVCRHYKLIEGFIEQQLQNFQGVADNVQAECTLLTLIIDGSNKGFRDIDGCTQLFVREELIQYTYNSIVKKTLFKMYEWLGKNPEHKIESHFNPIHIATIIRFLFYFRIYFPKE